MIVFTRVTKDTELEQVLGLQRRNLLTTVSSEEKEKEGFVTVSHTLDMLQRMNRVCPHFIAKDGDLVVGYALCMHPRFGEDIEVLKPMFREMETLLPQHKRYLVMGQICIDKAYRKMGVFRKLYETMSASVFPNYSLIITEVDAVNIRSLNAHYAIGFKEIKSYSFGGQDWKLIGLETI